MYIIYSLLALTSITAAKRVSRVALDYSVYTTVIHTPKTLTGYGCSYSVKVKNEELDTVVAISRKMGLEIYGAYKEVKDNKKFTYIKVEV